MSFPKHTDRNVGKNISKKLSSKYSQKLLDDAKQFSTDAFKTALKRAIQKTAEATGELIGNKIADKITRVSKILPQNNSEGNMEHAREIHRKRYQNKTKIIGTTTESYWRPKINIVIMSLLDDTRNRPFKFRTRNWVETNDKS